MIARANLQFTHFVKGCILLLSINTFAFKNVSAFSDIFCLADTLTGDTSAVTVPATTDNNSLKSKVKYSSDDSMRVDIANEKVYLYKNAKIDYEDLHLEANYIVIDWAAREIYAEGILDTAGTLQGKPAFSQGEQNFKSTAIRYNFDTKRGKITYVITQQGEGYILGETVKKNEYNDFFIRKGQYTTCNLEHPHFAITSNKLKMVRNKRIVTGPAYLTIEDVPTPLLIPFGYFPSSNKRTSGLLFPAFSESNERGFYFSKLGWYFAINDYVDFTVQTDLYTKGSINVSGISHYRKRYKYSGDFSVSYSRLLTSEKELPDFAIAKDFSIRWLHSMDSKARPNTSFSASVQAGTSSYYRNNISSPVNYLNNDLNSSISYNHSFAQGKYNFSAQARHNQNISTRLVTITLPELSLSKTRAFPFKRELAAGTERWYEKIGYSISANTKNVISVADSNLFKSYSYPDSLENGMQLSIPISASYKVLKYFTLTPSITLNDRLYLKTILYQYNGEGNITDTTYVDGFKHAYDYSTSASLSTILYGMYSFKKGPVAAIRHVMTPSLSFSYRPDFSESQYGFYRNVQLPAGTKQYSIFNEGTYGSPAAGKFGSVGFTLNNNLEMKVRTESDTGEVLKKVKILESLSIGSSYNLIADSLNFAPTRINGRTTLFEKVGLTFGSSLDIYDVNSKNIRSNIYVKDTQNKLARVTNANVGIDFSLNQLSGDKSSKYNNEELRAFSLNPNDYYDFEIPFNLRAGYQLVYNKPDKRPHTVIQTLNLNADVNLTPKWKLTGNTNYDFDAKQFSYANVSIIRDLHCWEMRLNWIPFGYQQSYNFQINVKSSILQDLKLTKKKDFYDR